MKCNTVSVLILLKNLMMTRTLFSILRYSIGSYSTKEPIINLGP